MSFKSVLIWIGNNNNIIGSLEKVVSAIATMPKGAWDGVGGGGWANTKFRGCLDNLSLNFVSKPTKKNLSLEKNFVSESRTLKAC